MLVCLQAVAASITGTAMSGSLSAAGAAALVGDAGRLAGDCSSEAFKAGCDPENSGCVMELLMLNFFGESLNASLNGEGGGRRAGLARIDEDSSFTGDVPSAVRSTSSLDVLL